jgi:uncharacterized membrane protein
MRLLLGYFARGLVVVTPLAITAYITWWVLDTVDGWLGLPIPGIGLLLTLAGITLVGFAASTVITRTLVGALETLFGRLPFVRLLYNSTRDLLNAFVGEQRRFDRPVLVAVNEHLRLLGFITQETLAGLDATGPLVAVYCPQSYNFAGQLLLVRPDQVTPLTAPASDVLAFIVSGGVTGAPTGASAAPAPSPAPRVAH